LSFRHLGSVIININIIVTAIQQTHQYASSSLLEIFVLISCQWLSPSNYFRFSGRLIYF